MFFSSLEDEKNVFFLSFLTLLDRKKDDGPVQLKILMNTAQEKEKPLAFLWALKGTTSAEGKEVRLGEIIVLPR